MLNRKRKYNLVILILMLGFGSIFAKQNTKEIAEIGNRIECYFNHKEKVFLHLNRNVIVSGDSLYFKAYYIKGDKFATDIDNCLYIQLNNISGKAILTSRFNISKGSCAGALYIPDSLLTGQYQLVAYTRWMLNFSTNVFFYSNVLVVNQSNPIDKISLGWTDTTKTESHMGNGQITISNNSNYITVFVSPGDKVGWYLLLINHGKIINNDILTNGNEVLLSKSNIPEGLSYLILLDNSLNLINEKVLYKPEKKDNSISCFTDKSEYKTKEKVKLSIFLKDKDGKPLKGNLSVSVAEEEPIDVRVMSQNIDDYLNLYSEINTDIYIPKSATMNVDSILLLSLSGIDWNSVADSTFGKVYYASEQQGHIISGEARFKSNDKPVTNMPILLSSPDKFATLKYSITDSSGKFVFRLNRNLDNQKLLISLYDLNSEIDYYLKFDTMYISGNTRKCMVGQNDSILKSFLAKNQKLSLVNKIYKKAVNNNQVSVFDSSQTNFFGNPDYSVNPSNYQELTNFEEIVANLLPGVRFKQKKDKYILETCDYKSEFPRFKSALLLVNNMPFYNYDILAGFGSKSIDYISITVKQFVYGNVEFNGLVSVVLKDKTILPDGVSTLLSNELNLDNSLSYNYSASIKECSKCPDFRPIIYWKPNCLIDENGLTILEFNTSLMKTKYVINVQGFTSKNLPISSQIKFEVK